MYLANVFYDVNGNFQWVSMTAFAALTVGIIGPIISIYNNKKTLEKQEQVNISNFKGNVVAKARIEWIQEVRNKSVDFMIACHNLIKFLPTHKDIDRLDKETKEKLSNLKNEVQKNGNLLILYFGPDPNKNNELIVYLVTTITTPLVNNKGWYDLKARGHTIKLTYKLEVLKDFLRIYFKAEWKRANGEIKDSDIQDYLEQHIIYVAIMRAFYDELEQYQETNVVYFGHYLAEEFKVKQP
ncbi:hypothetical protein CN374_29080 [Bacillus cereus]|nr:hypothetical protein CN374_29080 [Bacillus cereus]